MGEKQVFSTRIDADYIKELKHLSVDAEKTLGSLLEEAIRDLLEKYKGVQQIRNQKSLKIPHNRPR